MKFYLGGAILFGLAMCFTSCEGTLDDVFGEWSRPTGNNGNTKTTIAVTSVTLDQTTLTKAVGDDAVTLTATVDPSDATDKTVTWKSSDASIAAVDANGKVTFVAVGTATITATATNGTDDTADDKTAECAVTVTATGHALSSAAVGEIICSDSKAYAVADKDNLPTGVTAVAMVAYMGSASDCTNGLAIALQDVSNNKLSWDNSGTNNGGDTAAQWCSAWNTSKPVTGGTWRLPSIKDWQYMFIGCGASGSYSANPNNMSYSGLASKLSTANGTALLEDNYWSSTEKDPGYDAWCLNFDDSSSHFYNDGSENSEFYVRACLAF